MNKTKIILCSSLKDFNLNDILNHINGCEVEEIIIDKEKLSSIEYMNLVSAINETFPQSQISTLKPETKKIIHYKRTNYDIGRIRFD